jgi:hypothetical protein
MKLIEDYSEEIINKPGIEVIEKEKKEHRLIGSFLRTPGLNLYAFDYRENKVYRLNIIKNTMAAVNIRENKLKVKPVRNDKIFIDSKHIPFEALNDRTAQNRVNKFIQGKIKELCNLKRKNLNPINLF